MNGKKAVVGGGQSVSEVEVYKPTQKAPQEKPKTQVGAKQVQAPSMILEEGKKAEDDASWAKKKLYTTWNSIPWACAPMIAGELGVAILKSLPGQKEALGLEPNYEELRFTPLENSFTRRPNGFFNWFKDIFEGKPYRLLSDMGEDGVLHSPKGGSLENVFPLTTISMIENPMALGILKKERVGQLESLVTEYDKKYQNPESMTTEQLLEALLYVGDQNSIMFYRQGFRDTQVVMAGLMIAKEIFSSGLGDDEKKKLVAAIFACFSTFDLKVPNRGYGREGVPHADLSFVDRKYDFADLTSMLEALGASKEFKALPPEMQERVARLFKIREELAQEAMGTITPIEFCRSTMYGLSKELGKRLVAEGKLKNADDMNFITIYELPDIVSGKAKVDEQVIAERRKAFGY